MGRDHSPRARQVYHRLERRIQRQRADMERAARREKRVIDGQEVEVTVCPPGHGQGLGLCDPVDRVRQEGHRKAPSR